MTKLWSHIHLLLLALNGSFGLSLKYLFLRAFNVQERGMPYDLIILLIVLNYHN